MTIAMCDMVLVSPMMTLRQDDGRFRMWGKVEIAGEVRYLRVVTLEDRITVHNAFLDRNFRPETA